MIKWFAYIVLVLIFAPCLLFAGIKNSRFNPVYIKGINVLPYKNAQKDTVSKTAKQREQEEKNKIKEVAKAKKQASPAKVDDSGDVHKPKSKRQRRPEGLERPPEIPRRNGN
jgi:hypothetical protein